MCGHDSSGLGLVGVAHTVSVGTLRKGGRSAFKADLQGMPNSSDVSL